MDNGGNYHWKKSKKMCQSKEEDENDEIYFLIKFPLLSLWISFGFSAIRQRWQINFSVLKCL